VRDHNGVITTFAATPTSSGTTPNGINSSGAIVGTVFDNAGIHGFVRSH